MKLAMLDLAAPKLALCAAALALLAATPPAGEKVHFATCTLPGVERGCIIAMSGGKTYNVTGAKPGMKVHQWVQGTGTVTNKMSFCMQGEVIGDFQPDPKQALVGCVALKPIRTRR